MAVVYDPSLTLATNNLRMVVNETESQDMPADTVDFGASWGAGWVDIGATENGITLAFNATRASLKIDQSPTAIKRPFTDENLELRTTMAEITPANLLFATGQGVLSTPVAPGVGTRGHTELIIAGNPIDEYRSFGAEMLMDDQEALRILLPYAVATGSPTLEARATTLAGIALVASGFPDPLNADAIVIVRDMIPAT